MQVILPDEQVHQIQLLIADLIQQEIENRLNNSNSINPFLNKQQTCNYLGISNNTLDSWIKKGCQLSVLEKQFDSICSRCNALY